MFYACVDFIINIFINIYKNEMKTLKYQSNLYTMKADSRCSNSIFFLKKKKNFSEMELKSLVLD